MRAPRSGLSVGRSWIGFAAAWLLLAAAAEARIGVQIIDRDDGLPSSQVQDVEQDAAGRLWFASPSGLVRYQGTHLDLLGKEDGLSSNGLRSLAAAPDGRLWIGTDVGVDVRDPSGRFRPLVAVKSWSHGVVEDLAFEPDGTAWIATTSGLMRWTEGGGVEPAADPRLRDVPIAAVERAADGVVWAATGDTGLLRSVGDGWREVVDAEIAAIGSIRTLATTATGILAGGERGLIELDAAGRPRRRLAVPEPIRAILPFGDELWLGIGGQLRLYRPRVDTWELLEVVLPEARINRLVADAEGNVWAATDDVGVVKVSILRHALRHVDTPCRTQIFSFAPTRSGELLVGGDRCSWRLRLSDLQPVEDLSELRGVQVWDLRQDGGGTLWAATEQGLLRRPPGGTFARLRLPPQVEAPARVLLERGEEMWVGTKAGLVAIRGETIHVLEDAAGATPGYVYTLSPATDDVVWIGTIGNGLWRGRPGAPLERVVRPNVKARGNVYSVASRGGRMVVSQGDELLSWEAGRAERWRTGDAVAGWSLLFGQSGGLWVGASNGLIQYDFASGREIARLTRATGLAGDEFTSSRSLWRSPDGRLFCGTTDGLSVVVPEALAGLRPIPPAQLADVSWENVEPVTDGGAYVVPAGRWALEARVFAPWYAAERSLVYRHRLRGFDDAWSPYRPAREHRIRYTALPPGVFELEVQASWPLVGTSPPRTVLRVEVLRPWWSRWWAIAVWVALLGGLIAAVWHRRTRRLVTRAEELQQTVSIKTAELRSAVDKLDELAHHDPLTGLPNQRRFWEQGRRFEARARRGIAFALIVIDLDDFKQVNDRFGHQVGDLVLKTAAERLRSVIRLDDAIARYGGEEFVVLVTADGEQAAAQAAERLRIGLSRESVVVEERKAFAIPVTASLGVARWQGDEDTLEAMFQRADAAMYEAKKTTKNRVVLWHPSLAEGDAERARRRTQSRQAV